jgi:ketosteroid isomerase-like protein
MATAHRAPDSPRLIDQIRSALENRDMDGLAQLYAEDAILEEVSATHPPAHPVVLRGREAIRARLHEESERDPVSGWERHLSSSRVVDGFETTDALAFTVLREFLAGDKVLQQHMARKKDGRIEHDRILTAWDEAEPG